MIGSPRHILLGALLAGALIAGIVAGCEYFRDSPEQELARARWKECAGDLRDVKIDRVDTDGRIRFTYVAANERDRVLACLRAAGDAGRPLPEPVASPVAGK
ncbi:MAG TPA: hypothetical protein VFE48_17365 [Methylomirabilota bacterium]|nr:hypothetical protein [Methylomirabilota bacterium]